MSDVGLLTLLAYNNAVRGQGDERSTDDDAPDVADRVIAG